MKEVYATIAALIAVGGYAPYLFQTIRNKVKPHPFTWFVWSIISAITFLGQVVKGAGVGAIPTLVAEILTIGIFLASLRNGFTNVVRSDKYYLAISLAGLIPWVLFNDPTISVAIAVGIDVVAFIPTYRKTYFDPESERSILYPANVIRHIFSLGALQSYNVATMLHSVAMIITNLAATILMMRSMKPNDEKTTV